MFYRSGPAFEEAVFGESSKEEVIARFWSEETDFDQAIRSVIEKPGPKHPDTLIGRSLFDFAERELRRLGVGTEGLIFRSAINTLADANLKVDGFFYLPCADRFPVIVDLFNLDQTEVVNAYYSSISEYPIYTEMDFQSDLFRYKMASARRRKGKSIFKDVLVRPNLGDYRYIVRGLPSDGRYIPAFLDIDTDAQNKRWENQFILTPYHTGSSKRRESFAKMVARYLASKVPGHEMAEQSH